MAVSVETSRGIGASVLRKEDAELLTGQSRFVDDIKVPGMVHMAVVRSPYAHARISSIDTTAARMLNGVSAVYTSDDLEFAAGVPCASNPTGKVRQPVRPPLAKGKVRHAGEPVAIVLAADRYVARDAADLVEVSYEPLPPVVDPVAAMQDGAALVHENLGSNVVFQRDRYDPGSEAGRVMLAHELTHVVQQRNGAPAAEGISSHGDAAEAEARAAADQIVAGNAVQVQATPGAAMARDEKEKPFWDSPIFKTIASGAGLLPGPIGPVAKLLNHPFQIARGAEAASEGNALQSAVELGGAATGVVGALAGLGGFSMLGAGGLGGAASAISSGGLGVLGTVGGLGAEAGATMSASAALTGGGLSGVAALGPGAAVAGAGIAGVGAGIGLDKLSDWVGDKITGNKEADHSISAGLGAGMSWIDNKIHGVSDDPVNNPNENYRNTWGYRLAQWLDD